MNKKRTDDFFERGNSNDGATATSFSAVSYFIFVRFLITVVGNIFKRSKWFKKYGPRPGLVVGQRVLNKKKDWLSAYQVDTEGLECWTEGRSRDFKSRPRDSKERPTGTKKAQKTFSSQFLVERKFRVAGFENPSLGNWRWLHTFRSQGKSRANVFEYILSGKSTWRSTSSELRFVFWDQGMPILEIKKDCVRYVLREIFKKERKMDHLSLQYWLESSKEPHVLVSVSETFKKKERKMDHLPLPYQLESSKAPPILMKMKSSKKFQVKIGMMKSSNDCSVHRSQLPPEKR